MSVPVISSGVLKTKFAPAMFGKAGAFCLVMLVLALSGEGSDRALAAQNSPVPDFSGVWGKQDFGYPVPYARRDGRSFVVIDGFDSAYLKPFVVQDLLERASYVRSGTGIFPLAETTCWPSGVPGIFNFRHIQVLQTEQEIIIFYRNNNQSRTIYLNEAHSDPVVPSWYGESVGHFEGDTLVVDTIGFLRRPEYSIDDWGTQVTEGLHVIERYRFFEGATNERPRRIVTGENAANPEFTINYSGKIIELAYTVEDRNTFKQPWSDKVYWRPVLTPPYLTENVCPENNRDWKHVMPTAPALDF
jgi:hypothetical protein